ncbi:MAG: 50S ribosomal protein L29 [Planctomycetota bacterium]
MTPKEIRNLDVPQIDEQIVKMQSKVFELRHQVATSQVEDLSQMQKLRRDIARLHTIRREKSTKGATK